MADKTTKNGGELLNSWKEIARYLDRGVRTVQRWETMGLPVHRPGGRGRSAVFAITSELDAWLRSCPTEARRAVLLEDQATVLQSKAPEPRKLYNNNAATQVTARLILESQKVREELAQCREQLRLAVEQLRRSVIQMSSPRSRSGAAALIFRSLQQSDAPTEDPKASN